MVYADVVIAKRGSSEELTYAVPAQIIPYIKVGSLVMVPVRDKKVKAIVTNMHKRVDQSLKGKVRELLSIDKNTSPISKSQLNVAKALAEKYLTNTSDIIFRQLSSTRSVPINNGENAEVTYLQGSWGQRVEYYKNVISKYKEVLIIFPTNEHKNYFAKIIKDISNYSLHKNINPKVLKLPTGNNIFLATVGKSFLNLSKNSLMIVDNPSHIGSRYSNRPYLKAEDIALLRAKHQGVDIVVGQSVLSPQQIIRIKDRSAILKVLSPDKKEVSIISRTGSKSLFTPAVTDEINVSLNNKEKICIFVASKGWSTGYFCNNCKNIHRCESCQRNIGVYPNKLSCSYCGYESNIPNSCSNCGAKDFIELGEGIDKFIKEIEQIYKDTPLQVIAGKSSSYKNNVLITVTTEKILSYPQANFDKVFVVSADRALSGSAVDERWKFLVILSELTSLSKEITIQTYFLEDSVWESLKPAGLKRFYKNELENRKKFLLPPYSSQLNFITSLKNKILLEKQSKEIDRELSKINKIEFVFSDIQKTRKNDYELRLQIIYPKTSSSLNKKLKDIIPPNWAVLAT